MLMHTDE